MIVAVVLKTFGAEYGAEGRVQVSILGDAVADYTLFTVEVTVMAYCVFLRRPLIV
jgi:hypothetical protein